MDFSDEFKFIKYREDLPFLLNKLNLTGMGVEVGVQKGEFSAHILKYWQGKKLYLVDTWREIKGYKDIANLDHNGHLDCMAKTFMATYPYFERATIIRELSTEAAKLFQDNSLDFIYIDANHAYDAVKEDINVWYPKVKTGGLLCGHDYVNSSFEQNKCAEFGVKSAVDEFAQEQALQVQVVWEAIKVIDTNDPVGSWFIQV